MDEQDQVSFDLYNDFIKTEPEIGTSQTMQNKQKFKIEDADATVNDFEYQMTEQFAPVEIKQEMTECEMPENEQGRNLQTNIDQGTVSKNMQSIKQELGKTSDVKVTDIKQEVSECIEAKTESVVCELLTSECDLPTLKTESTDYYADNYLGRTYSRKPLKNTSHVILKKKRRRRYECPICQNNFPSSSRLTHIDGHFVKRFVVCQFCGRLLRNNDFFQHFFIHAVKNVKKNNIDDRPLKYNPRSKKLKQKNINEVDDNSFKCVTCFKTFNVKFKLRRHLIIHSSEKPFKCNICFKLFKRKYHLQAHLRTHSGEKPFKCDICHKAFNRKAHLQDHLIIHSGEKPFKCDICSKAFYRNCDLQRHLLIHSGEKPYKCDICSKSFTHKLYMQRHLKIHISKLKLN